MFVSTLVLTPTAGAVTTPQPSAAEGADYEIVPLEEAIGLPVPTETGPGSYRGYAVVELEAVAESIDGSLDEAVDLRNDQLAFGSIIRAAQATHAESFGGYEVRTEDARTSLVLLQFTRASDAEGLREQLVHGVPQAAQVTTEYVEHTERLLLDTYAKLNTMWAEFIEAGVEPSEFTVERRANTVFFYVPDLTDEQRVMAEDLFEGLPVTVAESIGTIEPMSCVSREDCNDLRGGIGTNASGSCTLGFAGADKTTGARYMVTAAHCSRYNTGVTFHQGYYSDNYLIGTNDRDADAFFGTCGGPDTCGYDTTRVRDSSSQVTTNPLVYHRGTAKDYKLKSLGNPNQQIAGANYCYSGYIRAANNNDSVACASAGCGPTTAAYDDHVWPNNYFFDSICSDPGDSGAPVYVSNQLVGQITARRNGPIFGSCTFGAGGIYTPAQYALAALNLNMVQAL